MIGLIVEGKNDVKKIETVINKNVQFIVLGGINFQAKQINEIKRALKQCEKVFICTDPDEAGNRAAKSIKEFFPTITRIAVNPNKAKIQKRKDTYRYGVEYCSARYLKTLFKRYGIIDSSTSFM